jgi:hypothetical protein
MARWLARGRVARRRTWWRADERRGGGGCCVNSAARPHNVSQNRLMLGCKPRDEKQRTEFALRGQAHNEVNL